MARMPKSWTKVLANVLVKKFKDGEVGVILIHYDSYRGAFLRDGYSVVGGKLSWVKKCMNQRRK